MEAIFKERRRKLRKQVVCGRYIAASFGSLKRVKDRGSRRHINYSKNRVGLYGYPYLSLHKSR